MSNVLVFLHSNYLQHNAGVEKVVLEQEHLFREKGFDFFAICPIPQVKLIFGQHLPLPTKEYLIIKNGKEEKRCSMSELAECVLKITWDAVIIHHLKNYSNRTILLSILKTLSDRSPIFIYIHDFATICFNHVLMKKGIYCSKKKIGTSFSKCCDCKFYLFSLLDHRFYKRLFSYINFSGIIFPSDVIYKIWHTAYPNVPEKSCKIIPHQKFSQDQARWEYTDVHEVKIAYVGYASPEKGWTFWKLLTTKLEGIMQYRFFVLGNTNETIPNVLYEPVSFLKSGKDAMVNALKRNNIDIAVLWSRRPETYSYTFYESYISRTFIITSVESGNIAHMVKKLRCGKVFASEMDCLRWLKDVKQVQDALNEFHKNNLYRPMELIPNDEIMEIIKTMS